MRPHAQSAVLPFLVVCVASIAACSFPWPTRPTTAPPPPLITGVDHILFTVADLDRSLTFYHDALGLTVEQRGCHFVWLRAGEAFGIVLSDKPWRFERTGEPKGVGMLPHFRVRDMNVLAERLKAKGIPWLRPPKNEAWGIEAFVADPDGYQWAFVAPRHHRWSGGRGRHG